MSTAPLLEFSFIDDRLLFRPVDAVIEQSIGMIDLAEVTTRRLAPGSSALVDDRPLSFTWGPRRPAAPLRTFQGYLEGSTERSIGTGTGMTNDVMLRLLGVGSVMRSKNSRVWKDATIPHVLADVCDGHRMNLVTDESTTRWRSIKQDEESDWHLVCRLAKKLGWWAHLDGATLLVLNPDKIMSRIPMVESLVTSPQFKQETDDTPGFGTHNAARRFATWSSDDGSQFTFHSDDRVPVMGAATSWSKIEQEVKIDDAYTHEEAAVTFEGADREAAWYIRRKVVVEGRADLRPLQPVVVKSPKVTQMNRTAPYEGWTQYDGVWLIESVCHRFVFGKDASFVTEVVLRRDARGPQPNVRQQRSGVETRFDTLPSARLLMGEWVASHRIAS